MLLHPSHACLQLCRKSSCEWKRLSPLSQTSQMCGHHIHRIAPFVMRARDVNVANALAFVCDCTEVVGFCRQ